jgi:hypothetical protein
MVIVIEQPQLRNGEAGIRVIYRDRKGRAESFGQNSETTVEQRLSSDELGMYLLEVGTGDEAQWKFRITTSSCKLARVRKVTQSIASIDF